MQTATDQKLVAAALKRLEHLNRQQAFDPVNPDSRPTEMQQQVINDFGRIRTQWIVAGNQSGKSQTCARILTWVLTDTHPSWKRPDKWGNEPLLALVCGKSSKILEESLLPKIESFLTPGTYKVVRVGNAVNRLEMENGNRIVFQSMENANLAADRIQSYVAHFVWIDEMPPTMKVLSEAMTRRNSRDGYFLASFTPLVVNVDIQRMVDASNGIYSKKYQFAMFDNPLYHDTEKQAQIISDYGHLPEHVRNTRLRGDWSQGDDQVYYFNYETMVEMPEGYSPLWRHVESVDPALSSALGLTLWAENPETGIWYCVLAEYVKGVSIPSEMVTTVQNLVKGRNIIRRTSDYAPWFTGQAASMGVHYATVYNKNNGRKPELIKQLQEKLGPVIRIAPHCEKLVHELQECRWSDRAEGKIINSSSYHLIDSAQYFVDIIPKRENKGIQYPTWEAWLYNTHMSREVAKEKAKQRVHQKIQVRNRWKQKR